MKNEDIIARYKGKILASRGYKSNKDNFFVEDLMNEIWLCKLIAELDSYESDLSPEGYEFLREYYGLENVAQIMLKNHPNFLDGNLNEVVELLKSAGEGALDLNWNELEEWKRDKKRTNNITN